MLAVSHYESDARVRRQAEALAARGDDVTVLALHTEGRPREELLDGVRVVRLPVRKYQGDSVRSYVGRYARFAARAAVWVARRPRRFDVIQAHSMPEALVFSAAVPRMLGTPLLLDVHDLSTQLLESKFAGRGSVRAAVRLSERAALGFAHAVLTVHEPYADTLRGLTRTPVEVVMNGPDERLFSPRPWRGWEPGSVTFGYHGLIADRHGLPQAVEALAGARAELPGARLLLWGAGDGLPSLRDRVAALRLEDAVELPAVALPVTAMAAQLERVDIGLVPSLLDPWTRHVLPTKLLEYAWIGIPVITFRNEVIARYFPPDSVTYVDRATPETLRAAMVALARDPDRARAQAERAREVAGGITWSAQRERYLGLVDRLGANGRG
jgi:glycosyltransferase involved in cell wall biosynthesis